MDFLNQSWGFSNKTTPAPRNTWVSCSTIKYETRYNVFVNGAGVSTVMVCPSSAIWGVNPGGLSACSFFNNTMIDENTFWVPDNPTSCYINGGPFANIAGDI